MVNYVLSNVEFGVATDPVETGSRACSVRRLELNADHLEAVGVGVKDTVLLGTRFDLFDRTTRCRHSGCLFESWGRAAVRGGVVVIEDAVIRYEGRGIQTPPSPSRGS